MSTAPHVIFATGAIGLATLDALRGRGESVRLVNLSGHARVPVDVEVVGGDASDPAFASAVSAGARVVYQTLGPPYGQWAAKFPALQAAVWPAAGVDVSVRSGRVTLRVADDGVGVGGPDGNGMVNLRARAEDRGGQFTVTAAEPHGTVVVWAVPLTS